MVKPDGPNRSSFTWKIALACTRIGTAGGALSDLLFKSIFNDTTRYFAAS
jgi:hypothetical protein